MTSVGPTVLLFQTVGKHGRFPGVTRVDGAPVHLPEERRVTAIAERALDSFNEKANMLSRVLSDREHLLCDEFSGADIALGYDCDWAAYTGTIAAHPELLAYDRLRSRTAFQKVFPGRG